jgi:Protein of unknown function (DUF2442)
MSISINNKSCLAIDVSINNDKLFVVIEDGREISVPLEWFPKLRNATKEQLNNWRFIGNGEGIHWNDLDEDISVEELFG